MNFKDRVPKTNIEAENYYSQFEDDYHPMVEYLIYIPSKDDEWNEWNEEEAS